MNCKIYPQNKKGHDSLLFKKLWKTIGDREEAIRLYAYTQSEISEKINEGNKFVDEGGEPLLAFRGDIPHKLEGLLAAGNIYPLDYSKASEQGSLEFMGTVQANKVGKYKYSGQVTDMNTALIEQANAINELFSKNKYDGIKATIVNPNDGTLMDVLITRKNDFVDNFIPKAPQTQEESFLIDLAFKPIEELISKKHRVLEANINEVNKKLNSSTTLKDKAELMAKRDELKKQKQELIEKKLKTKQEIKSQNDFMSIIDYANKNLDEVRTLLADTENLSYQDLFVMEETLQLWIKAGDFSTDGIQSHPFLDDVELQMGGEDVVSPKKIFKELSGAAEELMVLLDQFKKEKLVEFVNRYTEVELSEEEIFAVHKNIWERVTTQTLNIGRFDQPILQAIYSAVTTSNKKARMEAVSRIEEIDKAIEELQKVMDIKDFAKIFLRPDKELVNRFDYSYFLQERNLWERAFGEGAVEGGVKNYNNWLKENTVAIDVRAFMEDGKGAESVVPDEFLHTDNYFDQARKEAHIKELKLHLGEKGFKRYEEVTLKKIEEYRLAREAVYSNLVLSGKLEEEVKADMDRWVKENSPYFSSYLQDNIGANKLPDGSYANPKGSYNLKIPKRVKQNGEETGWYDPSFSNIESDKNLFKFYTFVVEILNEGKAVLPENRTTHIHNNTLPWLEKDFIDLCSGDKVKFGANVLYDKIMAAVSTPVLGTEDISERTPLGNIVKKIQINYLPDLSAKVQEIVDIKTAEHFSIHKEKPSKEKLLEFRREAKIEVNKDKSTDIEKILKAFSLMSLAYKHKSAIESELRLAEQLFSQIKVEETNAAGESIMRNGKPVKLENATQYVEALSFFLDSTYYGTKTEKVELATKHRVLSSQEKLTKQYLEEAIQNVDNALKGTLGEKEREYLGLLKKSFEIRITKLGSVITGKDIGNSVLKWVQLKGLGWNPLAAAANIGFGVISNWIEAGDGRAYGQAELAKATMMVMDTVASNVPIESLRTKRSLKIKNLMAKFDVLATAAKELFESSGETDFSGWAAKLSPYELQKSTEYLIQSQVLVAMMLKEKATNNAGEEVSLWEALDEHGNLIDGYSLKEDDIAEYLAKFSTKVGRIIAANHGDYANKLKIKEILLGRAFMQFRTWMIEGFANRFEKEMPDYVLGYTRKGRYRTGFGIVSWAENTGMNSFQQTIFNLQQLLKKLTFGAFGKTTYDEKGFTPEDAANMRKNLNEMIIYMMLIILSSLGSDDDDEREKGGKMANLLLNLGNRMETDILFYVNPVETHKILKSILPAMGLAKNIDEITTAIVRQFGDNPDIMSGPNKDRNALLVAILKATPGASQILRVESQYKRAF